MAHPQPSPADDRRAAQGPQRFPEADEPARPPSSATGGRFSVIVVNLNGAGTLVRAVRSALAEAVPAGQIAIVDNGSTDRSLAELNAETPGTLLIANRYNHGFARAVNQALPLFATEFLLLLNNDAELAPGALEAFAAAFDRNPRLAIAGGQLSYPGGRLQSAFAPLPTLAQEVVPVSLLKLWRPGRYVRSTAQVQPREVESVFGACLAVRAAALASIGPLDEDFFFYFEEVDWCRRARLHGWQVWYVPAARALHQLGHTASRYRGRARIELQRSKLIYFRKAGSRAAFAVLSGYLVFRTLVNALFGTLAVAATLGLRARLRDKTRAYWHMFAWHMAGRPADWGLPGKAPADR